MYFKEHMEADVRHTASWKALINSVTPDEHKAISAAERSVTYQNLLLDSCYEEYC